MLGAQELLVHPYREMARTMRAPDYCTHVQENGALRWRTIDAHIMTGTWYTLLKNKTNNFRSPSVLCFLDRSTRRVYTGFSLPLGTVSTGSQH